MGAWDLRTRFSASIAALALALLTLALAAPRASGSGSLTQLSSRMDEIRARLDRATARIEELRTREDGLIRRIREIEARQVVLNRRNRRLEGLAAERADALYRDGATGMLEALFGADDFSELTSRAELMSALSRQDADVFGRLARTQLELRHLAGELGNRRAEIARTREEIRSRATALQREFEAVQAEYTELQEKLARARARTDDAPSAPADQPEPAAVHAPVTDGMACPVSGPVSFIDSWGAPRDGHTHQGVDMMAAYGTPVVAIVSGNITYAAYDGSGGNMIFLSGDDGNDYWYMHNQENLVAGGHVQTGQQIATVGDTGNAEGTPHLHFEYHPGGGAAVNPYPLVASIC